MANGIDLRGSEQVLQSFDLNATPFFAIYQGKDLKFQHLENDIDSAKELLVNNLNVLEQGGSSAPLKIVYYYDLNSNGKLSNENIKGSNTFRICNGGPSNYNSFNDGQVIPIPYRESRANREQEARILALEQRLLEAEAEEEEETPQAVGGMQGVLAGLLNNPQIQDALVGRLIGFLDKILPAQTPAGNIPAMVSGASDDDQQIRQSLQTLFSKGMTVADIQKLANIAETQTPYFNTLLSMLRG